MLIAAGCVLLAAAVLCIDPAWLRALDPRAAWPARARRRALPGLVDAIGAALASGLSLELAFAEVAPAMPAPLDASCRRVACALRLGDPVETALRALTPAAPAEDVAPFSVVLASFARSGGRVQRSLGRVAALLRARIALVDEQQALTAQGRISALVLIALAPLGCAFFAVLMPSYLPTLLERGLWMVFAAATLEVIGALWLARVVRSVGSAPDLASLLDAVVVGLEAGLTFQQALEELVRRAPAVARLPDARRLLADLSLARGSGAFAAFAAAGPAEARVAGLVLTAGRLGAPLAGLLIAQAEALRDESRRLAQARARRLPVLLLFPLTFCVLPALLLVFLGPPLLTLLQ